MSEESIKRSTKGHQKSEREQNGSKAKKGRKPGTAKSHGLCEGLQRSAPSITEPESTADSTLARRAENQPSNTPPDTLSKMKMSKKRKQRDCGAILDESVDAETDATELEPPKNKKRDEYREEDRVHHLAYPDPAIDESLSEQSRRALSYAYGRCRGIEAWKFNKARQNWLLRNVWLEQAVPESYLPLVIRYLVGIRGGAREKLIGECISKTSTSEEAPMQGPQPSDDGNKAGFTINQQPNTSRALSILHALREDS